MSYPKAAYSGPLWRTRLIKPIPPRFKLTNPCRRVHVMAGSVGENDPYDVLQIPRGSSGEAIKASYYRLIKQLHPDLNPDGDTTAAAVRLNAAYEALMEAGLLAVDGMGIAIDVFDYPEVEATEIFANPFACYNVNPCDWEKLQEMAENAVDDPENELRCLGAGPSGGAIEYVTPAQLKALLEELERMGPATDPVTVEACAYYVRDCLYRARVANGRRSSKGAR